MMTPIWIVDAFTEQPFGGNPAAVCLLDHWRSAECLQLVAREMNLSETAFLVALAANEFELRWFTPKVEVELCGHATLAAAHIVWETQRTGPAEIGFQTKSGRLTATRLPNNAIELDFPAQPAIPWPGSAELGQALGTADWVAAGRNDCDLLVELASADTVRHLEPDFEHLQKIDCRGVIVTARSDHHQFDFISRFFAPAVGVNEDPVTGSAHCCLSEWWGDKLGKDQLVGYQASERGGVVRMRRRGKRVKLIGTAVTVMRGELLK
jgi:PhzF family phenazine biosynthesis protein